MYCIYYYDQLIMFTWWWVWNIRSCVQVRLTFKYEATGQTCPNDYLPNLLMVHCAVRPVHAVGDYNGGCYSQQNNQSTHTEHHMVHKQNCLNWCAMLLIWQVRQSFLIIGTLVIVTSCPIHCWHHPMPGEQNTASTPELNFQYTTCIVYRVSCIVYRVPCIVYFDTRKYIHDKLI